MGGATANQLRMRSLRTTSFGGSLKMQMSMLLVLVFVRGHAVI